MMPRLILNDSLSRKRPWLIQSGFTFIELIIVMVIVAILLMVALPSYQQFILKSRRSDAMSALMNVTNRQEQFMLDSNTYTVKMTDLGFITDPYITPNSHYSIVAIPGTTGSITTSYSLTASPKTTSSQLNDHLCSSFTITSSGAKSATGSLGTQCWGL